MGRIAAVTTCNQLGYERYGHRMIEAFERHWPKDIPLYFYIEQFLPVVASERISLIDLLDACPDLVAFKERHRHNSRANGQSPETTRVIHVRKKKRENSLIPKIKVCRLPRGRGYRWDAVRFSHKMFAIFDAAERCKADVLYWIDADVFTFSDIPLGFLESLMPENCLVSFLKRAYCSECGFVGYNLRHPAIGTFLSEFRSMYTMDKFLREKEFHDSWLFDVLRKRFERKGFLTHDISGGLGAGIGHIFINSVLGKYMDHAKGGRWANGSSSARDLVTSREELYWTQILRAPAESC
jgi:hypothetical protein